MKKFLFVATAFAALSLTAAGCSLFGKDDNKDNGGDHDHEYYETVISPTCTERGYTRHFCDCGESYDDSFVNALGHDFVSYSSDNNATCTKDGTKTAYCTRQGCNAHDTVADADSKLGHSFTTYKKDDNATCTEDGTKTAVCDRDGCDETDTVADEKSMLGHKFGFYASDGNATCTEDGTKTAHCTRQGCDETDTVANVGSKLNHLFTNYIPNGDYTCTEDGTKTATCEREGCSETDTVDDQGSAAHRFAEGFCSVCKQEEYTEGLEFELSADGEYYTVKRYAGSEAEVKVPALYEKLPVTKIAAGAFREDGTTHLVTKITLPDGITEIGAGAFGSCALLEEINLPSGITKIESSTFAGCEKLESVDIPSGVTQIGDYAFYLCKALKSVTIPEKVTSIGAYAFYCTYGLEELNFNAKNCANFENDSRVFSYAGRDSEGVAFTVGDEVNALPLNIFYDTNDGYRINVTYFNSGNGINHVEGSLFIRFASLKEVVIGDSVNTIRGDAFKSCTALEKVTLGSKLTAIGRDAFYMCEAIDEVYAAGFDEWCAITFNNMYSNPALYAKKLYLDGEEFSGELTIPTTLTQIKPYAFHNWKGITGVTFHAGVTSIGVDAFRNCTNIAFVDIADVAAWCEAEINNNPVSFCNKLYLNGELIRELVIPEGVTSISTLAFAGCYPIVRVTLPASLASIGNSAFASCYSLAEVENHSSIALGEPHAYGTSGQHGGIMTNAYGKCTSEAGRRLAVVDGFYVYKSEGKDYVVGYNGNSTAAQLPANSNGRKYEINNYAFYNSDLTSVVLPDDVEKISAHAFENCAALASVTMGTGTQEIEANAFTGCTALSSLTLPSGLRRIGKEAFKGCTSLAAVAIGDHVTDIGDSAFRGCSILEEVSIGRAVYTIGQYAFEGSALIRATFAVKDEWKVYNPKTELLKDPVDVTSATNAAKELRLDKADKCWMCEAVR